MRISVGLAMLMIGASPVLAKECRMPDVPPGLQVQLPPGCKEPMRSNERAASKQDSLRADQGFIDLGNGTTVRVGGRIRAEVGARP